MHVPNITTTYVIVGKGTFFIFNFESRLQTSSEYLILFSVVGEFFVFPFSSVTVRSENKERKTGEWGGARLYPKQIICQKGGFTWMDHTLNNTHNLK